MSIIEMRGQHNICLRILSQEEGDEDEEEEAAAAQEITGHNILWHISPCPLFGQK